MFGGDDDVFRAGLASEGGPGLRVVGVGGKLRTEGLVVGDRDGSHAQEPLAALSVVTAFPLAGGHGVNAPVDEKAETCLMKPSGAGIARRSGLGLGGCAGGEGGGCGEQGQEAVVSEGGIHAREGA